MPKMVRTIGIKPETWADRWVELGTLKVATAVSFELVKDVATTPAPATTNNRSGTQQPTYAIPFPDEVNATATAGSPREPLGSASPSSTSFDINNVVAMIGDALVVFCGFPVALRYPDKQRYGGIPIDPCMVPVDLASRRRIVAR
jgi:hypothetical protein